MTIRVKGGMPSTILIWFLLLFLMGNVGIFSSLFSTSGGTQPYVTEDSYMSTQDYTTQITVEEDNSYLVREDIAVTFVSFRHGIYRYVPQKGVITETRADGELSEIPYYASFSDIACSVPLSSESENGNKVFQMGDPDHEVYGEQHYALQYHVTPVTSQGYPNAYYNIYPTGWRNAIPAGSRFSITFPKEIDPKALRLYYGRYGESLDAAAITSLTWNGRTVEGTLLEDLPVGVGMTFYAGMEDGYFQNLHTTRGTMLMLAGVSVGVLAVLLVLFFLFGRDEPIIPSVQFQPPAGLDSAAVGYIVDGSVSDTDVMSLLLYWADQGYLRIRQTKAKTLAFTPLKDLPEDAPQYAKTFFHGIFGRNGVNEGREVSTSDLRYRMASTFVRTKQQIKGQYASMVYTASSQAVRLLSMVLSCVPLLVMIVTLVRMTFVNGFVLLMAAAYVIGVFLFNNAVDFWYSRSPAGRRLLGGTAVVLWLSPLAIFLLLYGWQMYNGSMLNLIPGMACVAVTSAVGAVLTGFMRKRTSQCISWMGYLAGLRDFIVTAELERMQMIAQDNPELFYHILPFAYVFGLSDILLDKMQDLTLPAPQWYEVPGGGPYFNHFVMYNMLHNQMPRVANVISTPRPPQSSGRGSGGSSGGFSGGGFGGGGGGFSGGGFGGGGGGSW